MKIENSSLHLWCQVVGVNNTSNLILNSLRFYTQSPLSEVARVNSFQKKCALPPAVDIQVVHVEVSASLNHGARVITLCV